MKRTRMWMRSRAQAAVGGGLLVVCAMSPGCGGGASIERSTAPGRPKSAFEQSVARLGADLERWEAFGFSGAVLVARGDAVPLSRGYGYADRSTKRAVTPGTLFDIGSLSKQFTAALVLALAEEGRLEIHGSISALLPGVPPDKALITVHHLLTHTSGISDFGSEAAMVSRDQLVGEILAAPLSQPPGTAYAYSNLGYTLLAAIVEIASGERFEDYLARTLLEPAGMRQTTVAWSPSVDPGRLALGYGGYKKPSRGEDPRERVRTWRARGSGNVLSTAEDLLRWHRALRTGRVLSRHSRDAMFTAQTTAEADFLSYGYGWRIQSTSDGKRLVWHSGLDEAYSTMFRHYVDEDLVVVFLSNLSIGGVPMRDVLVPPSRSGPPSSQLLSEAVSSAPLYVEDDRRLASYRGRYRVGQAAWWMAEVEDSAIVLRAEGQEAIDALYPPADASIAAWYNRASEEAVRLARCLAGGGCPSEELARIDPYGYAGRSASVIAQEWRNHGARLGELVEVGALGTTRLRGRRPDQMVTHIRLVFAHGSVDEHAIWFADDEIYWVPGCPSTIAVRFKAAPGAGLVGFDLLKQGVYHAELSDEGTWLTIETGRWVVQGAREL